MIEISDYVASQRVNQDLTWTDVTRCVEYGERAFFWTFIYVLAPTPVPNKPLIHWSEPQLTNYTIRFVNTPNIEMQLFAFARHINALLCNAVPVNDGTNIMVVINV